MIIYKNKKLWLNKNNIDLFFSKNQKILITFLMIIFSFLISGYFWYNYNNKKSILISSDYWEKINSNWKNNYDQFQLNCIQHFIDQNNNIYGILASLDLVRYYVNIGNFIIAEKK